MTLLFFIRVPAAPQSANADEPILRSARAGLAWLRRKALILKLILFLACINLVASAYNAALPALLLSRPQGGETVLGWVNAVSGLATLAGSVLVALLPAPKNRVKVICLTLMLSMGTENFLLALGKTPLVWCVGSVLGWIGIPIMNANLDVILRSSIPADMQGRVYSCRNTLQFFTIPLGFFLGGVLVDEVFSPLMAAAPPGGMLDRLFGGPGAGAAATFCVLAVMGVAVCAAFFFFLRRESWRDGDSTR